MKVALFAGPADGLMVSIAPWLDELRVATSTPVSIAEEVVSSNDLSIGAIGLGYSIAVYRWCRRCGRFEYRPDR